MQNPKREVPLPQFHVFSNNKTGKAPPTCALSSCSLARLRSPSRGCALSAACGAWFLHPLTPSPSRSFAALDCLYISVSAAERRKGGGWSVGQRFHWGNIACRHVFRLMQYLFFFTYRNCLLIIYRTLDYKSRGWFLWCLNVFLVKFIKWTRTSW